MDYPTVCITQGALYEMGGYSLLFYISHVVTIVVVANIVFWLKDIDPRFRQGDDADFDDIPSLREHKEKLLKDGKAAVSNITQRHYECISTTAASSNRLLNNFHFSCVYTIRIRAKE